MISGKSQLFNFIKIKILCPDFNPFNFTLLKHEETVMVKVTCSVINDTLN